MEGLAAEIRSAERDDIICLMKDRAWFIGYEDRHRYDLFVSFKDTVALVDKETRQLCKAYKNKYGVEIRGRG